MIVVLCANNKLTALLDGACKKWEVSGAVKVVHFILRLQFMHTHVLHMLHPVHPTNHVFALIVRMHDGQRTLKTLPGMPALCRKSFHKCECLPLTAPPHDDDRINVHPALILG